MTARLISARDRFSPAIYRRCSVSTIVLAGNWISSIAGVEDVNRYNQAQDTARLRVAPRLVAVASGRDSLVGSELMRFGFWS